MNYYNDTTANCDGHRLREQIRGRAYQLYEARGRGDGRALDDWLEAEREVEQYLRLELASRSLTIRLRGE